MTAKNSKRQIERAMNEAAEGVAGLSPMIGMRPEDIADALKSTGLQSIKQPLVAVKHSAGFAAKLVDVLAGRSEYTVGRRDRRFVDDSWRESGWYQRILQGYLALDSSLSDWAGDLDLDDVDAQKARFVVDILTDSLAPTNNLLTNPAALKKLRATRGGSLVQGLRHLVDDIRNNNGMPAQVDKSQFEVGGNLATSEGAVVFRNEILELIQYTPQTSTVYQRPLLVVPPQINKFYVFDLTPEKSLF